MHVHVDVICSDLARCIIEAGIYSNLVVTDATSSAARKLLGSVTPDQLLPGPVTNPVAAWAMLAGLWLLHDGLHECHEIVQKSARDLCRAAPFLHQTPSKTGREVGSVQSVASDGALNDEHWDDMDRTLAYWHGIMHRREGDFSNSHYWFRRAGRHPAMRLIEDYDGHAFIDEMEAAHAKGESPAELIEKQRQEWIGLFQWCAQATGA